MSNSHDSSTDANQSAPEPTPWPEQAFPLKDVQDWVASALGLSAPTVLPVTVYVAYTTDTPDQRMTARLVIESGAAPPCEVVFKGNRMPLLSGSARAHALVSRHCDGMVPRVLAWEDDNGNNGSSRLLYKPFEGRSIGDSGERASLIETARAVARIQNLVAESGEADSAGLSRVTAEEIPAAFDAVFDHIKAHIRAWQDDEDGKISKASGSPAAEVLTVLSLARPQVSLCAAAVAALGLPTTIDHGDLHGGNAIIQKDGTPLIYDWETATVGCPLFSVEKLLVAAWSMDENLGGNGPWGYAPATPTQALLRDAYLDALGRTDIDAQTFAQAMCLATVKEMSAEIEWAKLMNWPDGNPEWTAQLIRRMRYHLQSGAPVV